MRAKGNRMFRQREAILLVCSFSTMALGIFLPGLAAPLAWAPMTFVMFLLFLSFLSIDVRRILSHALATPVATALVLAGKTLLLPISSFFLFHFLWPRYELAALLMAGASTAVLAPFFAALFQADVLLTAGIVLLSSLLLPFSLPPLVAILSGRTLEVGVLSMMKMLAMMVFVPALLGQTCTRWLPRCADWLIGRRYPLSLLAIGITNIGVFSRYSEYFVRSPALALEAVIAGTLLVVWVLLCGPLAFFRTGPSFRSTALICTVFPNYILILAFSSEFFGPTEATFAAVYSIPFFLQLLPLRKLLSKF
jgi:predicted Na+-dependent transporter